MKTALIIGIGGQDGSLLARYLLRKQYLVYGTSRHGSNGVFSNLDKLKIRNLVHILSMNPEDYVSVSRTLDITKPDEIYFLAGQSSVGLSFEQPAETIQSFTLGTLNILEVCRGLKKNIKQYHAGSSECFGDTAGVAANETTPFRPRSPYAVAKASSYWLVDNYREAYGLYACTGILFNHESPLRPARFVTQKIIQAASRIANGSNEKLELGRLDIARDWGWAPDYVEAMWLMLQQNIPSDYVIATGVTSTLEEFVYEAFHQVGLNWQSHVQQSTLLHRPTDIAISSSDPRKAKSELQWIAKTKMKEVVNKMLRNVLD